MVENHRENAHTAIDANLKAHHQSLLTAGDGDADLFPPVKAHDFGGVPACREGEAVKN